MHELVKMTRDAPTFPGGPVSADVCPDDVAQWEGSGWVVRAEEEPPASPSDGEKTLEQMTLAELRDHAKAHGIAIPRDDHRQGRRAGPCPRRQRSPRRQ